MNRIGKTVKWIDNGNTRIGVVQRSETVYRNSGDVVECLVVLVSGDQSARGWRLIQDREAQDVDTK